jgi:CDP-diacylglycerol--serine O-phosphatidyltransferase
MLGFYNYTVILTYLSLCSGITGIYLTLCGKSTGAAIVCLLLCGLFDAFDGRVARMRKQSTPEEKRFGIQIDSLADLICFGVLPCCIGYSSGMTSPLYVPVFCLFVLAALIRLAYFNVTEEVRQSKTTEKRKNYHGLPVTSISLIMPFFSLTKFIPVVGDYLRFVFLGVMILTAAAFVTESIKIRKPNFKGILVLIFIGLVELAILITLRILN